MFMREESGGEGGFKRGRIWRIAKVATTTILMLSTVFAVLALTGATRAESGAIDLGTISGYDTRAEVVNDNGQVMGTVWTVGQYTGFYWDVSTGIVDIGIYSGYDYTLARDMNDDGVIVGSEAGYQKSAAFAWDHVSQSMMLLGDSSGGHYSAEAINGLGTIVGESASGGSYLACYWELYLYGSPPKFLNYPFGTESYATGVTEDNDLFGYALTDGLEHAFWYSIQRRPQMFDIGALLPAGTRSWGEHMEGSYGTGRYILGSDWGAFVYTTSPSPGAILATFPGAYIHDVNAVGQVVGHGTSGATSGAFVSSPPYTSVTLLDTGVGTGADPCDINSFGQITGFVVVTGGVSHACLWDPASSYACIDLGTLTGAAGSISGGMSINENGQVAGYSDLGPGTVKHAVLWQTLPVARFTSGWIDVTGTQATAHLDASTSDDFDGWIVDYAWDFGDGETGSGVTVDHTYVMPGTYTVTLTVTDDLGSTGSTSRVLDASGPIAVFTYDWTSATGALTARFDASASTDAVGAIVNYAWDFGDNTAGLGMTIYHTYATAGTYPVTLMITDDLGLTDTTQQTVVANSVQAFSDEIDDLQDAIFACSAPDAVKQDLSADAAKAESQYGARKSHGADAAATTLLGMVTKIEGYTIANDINPGTGLSPADGWKLTCMADLLIALLCNQVMVSGVPNYEWYHGCGPTTLGMIVGYWDTMRFNDLVPWDTSEQDSDVNSMIASAEHISDYAWFPDGLEGQDDAQPILIPDASEGALGRIPHDDNSIADFMHTSFSKDLCAWGEGLPKYIVSGFTGYVSSVSPHLDGTETDKYTPSAKEVTGKSLAWSYVTRQLKQRPMAFLIDMNGDHKLDHLAPVMGYCAIGKSKLYAFYSTWDNTIWWANFELMSQTTFFGVHAVYEFNIVQASGS